MKNALKLTTVASMIALASGCSSFSEKTYDERIEEARQIKIEAMEDQVDNLPEFFSNPPKSTPNVVYVTGTGASSNLVIARNKAVLDAQTQLADQINGVVSSDTKQRLVDGVAASAVLNDQVIRKLIAEVSTSGYVIEKQKLQLVQTGKFQYYVLLAYPIGEDNAIQMYKLKEEMTRRSFESNKDRFAELDAQVEKSKQKKAQ